MKTTKQSYQSDFCPEHSIVLLLGWPGKSQVVDRINLGIPSAYLDLVPKSISRTTLLCECRTVIKELVTGRKQRVLVNIDEAQLLRLDVLSELHTVMNFDHDGANYMTMVLCGQPGLLENLQYRAAAPLVSRIMSKAQIRALTQGEMAEYLHHHLRVAGVKTELFEPNAIMAIQQGSAGGLRRAN